MAVTNADCRLRIADYRKVKSPEIIPKFALLIAFLIIAIAAPVSFCTAQETAPNSQAAIRNSSYITTAPNGKKMVLTEGKPTPLFWADGVSQIPQLEEYARTGFNTVVVHLGWRPTQNGSLVLEDLEPPRAFATAAAQRGLHVIYSLPPAPQGMERAFRVSADSDPYFTLWSAWVGGAINNLKDTPNLIGWMLPDDPRGLTFYDDKGYSNWLTANYAGIEILNTHWSATFPTIAEVTLASTKQLIERWHGMGPITGALTQAELEERIKQMNERPRAQNFAFHPASLALAQYKWDAYRGLLERWADTIREIDPDRLILSGRLPDYAQLLSVPAQIDISMPALQPGVGEADIATHNPQAVDIARRGGRFAVMPAFTTAGSATLHEDDLPRLVPSWADAALAHGASGFSFASWADVQKQPLLLRSITATLERLKRPPFVDLWTQPPVATAAIVLTPLADGYTLQMGSEALPDTRGLYGFAEDLINGEPSDLVYALRWGTAFGGVDYLSPDDLEGNASQLNRYGVLLLPQALSVSPEMTRNLKSYANAGGVVVADLGVGAAQMGGRVNLLTPALADLFGLAPLGTTPVTEMRALSFNLQLMNPHALLPTWSNQNGTLLTSGDGPHGAAFVGPVAFPKLLPGTIPLALGQQLIERLGPRPRPGSPTLLQRSQLSLNSIGRGYALFAPFRMWNFWRPGQTGFDAFHGDLFARGAALAQYGATSFVPVPGGDEEEEARYPEIANFPTSIALLNHNTARLAPAPPRPTPVPLGSQPAKPAPTNNTPSFIGNQQIVIQTAGVGNFLWSGAVCSFPSGDAAQLSGGRPAPINEPTEFETQPHMVTLYANIKAQQMAALRLIPVRAQNTEGGPLMTHVSEYSAKSIKMLIWPNATIIVPQPQAEDFQVSVAEPSPVRLTLYDINGEHNYHVAPNSRHRIIKIDLLAPADKQGRRPFSNQILSADERGRLNIELTGAATSIEIRRD